MKKLFKKTVEDFVCENCGANVFGNGYTNHCPKCLWSKHVDVNPGDREGRCQGGMKPVSGDKDGKGYYIIHECTRCGLKKRKLLDADDDFKMFIEISKNQ